MVLEITQECDLSLSHAHTVIHLFTGRQLCHVNLKAHTVHADINSDGVIGMKGWGEGRGKRKSRLNYDCIRSPGDIHDDALGEHARSVCIRTHFFQMFGNGYFRRSSNAPLVQWDDLWRQFAVGKPERFLTSEELRGACGGQDPNDHSGCSGTVAEDRQGFVISSSQLCLQSWAAPEVWSAFETIL